MWDEDNAPSAPTTACRRCRKHKLRCSRDLPICKRCSDIASICEYPLPPDRKLLAAKRVQNAKARARRESENSVASLQGQQELPADGKSLPANAPTSISRGSFANGSTGLHKSDGCHQFGNEISPDEYRALPASLQASLRETTLPSSEEARFLFEIYFSHLYNASLLFHKRTLLSDYAANKVPDFVALSIFALASIFLGAAQGQSPQDNDKDGVDLDMSMKSTQFSAKQGFEWATAASQRVLLQADVPRLETVQTCQNLALYWFSRGQTHRTHMHTHTAYRTARLLNLHKQPNEDGGIEFNLLEELNRRCFWSCWATSCISQDNADFKNKPWQEVTGLALPSDEESFSLGRPISAECFGDNGELESLGTTHFKPGPSPMGELLKLVELWWEVQHFVKIHKESHSADTPGRIATLLEFDRRLDLIFDGLHSDLRYENETSFKSPRVDPYKLFSIHCLYRLCACALHTSIVPLFSETPADSRVSQKLVRISVEQSVKHAGVILDMAAVFLTTRSDISRLPSITGYAMFVASTVHFKSLVAQRKLQQHGISRFKAAICIIERLKGYWATNQGLWNMLKNLFAPKGIQIETISQSESRANTNSEYRHTDVDKIVSHEGTPQESQGTDIYTYVVQESTAVSPLRRADAESIKRTTAQALHNFAPSSTVNLPAPSESLHNAAHRVAKNADLRRVNPGPKRVGLPRQQHDISPSSQLPITRNPSAYHPPFAGNSQNVGTNFLPLVGGSVPMPLATGDYQMQGNNIGMNQVQPRIEQHMDGSIDARPYVSSGMDVDGVNFWWDQSYGMAFDADPSHIQMNFSPDGSGAYQHQQRFSYGETYFR